MKFVDFLIIGQGLAGSVLGYEMLKRGYKIRIIDNPEITRASAVAAGLFNALTGRGLVKTWMADKIFPYLEDFYPSMEKDLNSRFYYPLPVFKPFVSAEEQNRWAGRSSEAGIKKYISDIHYQPYNAQLFQNPNGGMMLKNAGYVKVDSLLSGSKAHFTKQKVFITQTFNERDLRIKNESIVYQDIQAGKVIYCNGLNASGSRYFYWLPFKPVKGELISVSVQKSPEYIYNRKIFVIPYTNRILKVGATYDWSVTDTDISSEARKYLEKELLKIMDLKYSVINQQAGIRPATRDRRPFIGFHPDIKTIGIFNGLGSKGVSLAPWMAGNLCDALEKNSEVETEMNINRYFSLYSSLQ